MEDFIKELMNRQRVYGGVEYDVHDEREIVKEILGIDIKVKTDKDREKILSYTDLKNCKDSTISLNYNDYGEHKCQIIVTINCDGYLLKVVDV